MGSKVVARRLCELGTVVGGATPSTKDDRNWNGEIPWLSPKDLTGYPCRYISRGEKSITQNGYESCSTKLLPAGSVLFSSRAPIGYVAIAANPVCTNQGFKSVVPNEGVSSLYLYYLLKCSKDRIEALGSGTTFKEVSGSVMRNVELPVLADVEQQERAASVLDSIDSKIELNNCINGYLAELIETIAKKYCEQGDIRLGDICYQAAERINCEEAELETYISTESLLQDKKGRQPAASLPATGKVVRFVAGDTLISNIRPYFKKVWYASFDGTCSSDVLVLRANVASNAPYIHACLRQDGFFDHVMRGAKGTKMPRGDKKQMMEFCVAPTCEPSDLSALDASLKQISANDAESAKLTTLRDNLLPKLMSGEIDVSKIDAARLNSHLFDY